MSSAPLVSVVTPSYNQVEFIEETIESVRTQTYRNVEHIIVDGGSTDGTIDILRQHDDSIEWISEPDDGQADAVNKGFDIADGEIIGWLNSDDVYFDTSVLDRIVGYFETFDADIIYGDIGLLDADSDVMKIRCVPDWDYERLLRGCYIEQPSLFFRQQALAVNRLDTELQYVMDYEFWLRLGQQYDFKHVSDILAGDRNHPNRKIIHSRNDMISETNDIARKYGRPAGLRYGLGRTTDIMVSGIPRRLRAIKETVTLHRNQPPFAFDGGLYPLHEMIRNTLRSNKNLL